MSEARGIVFQLTVKALFLGEFEQMMIMMKILNHDHQEIVRSARVLIKDL